MTIHLGSIIEGTMRPEDLIPEFADELKKAIGNRREEENRLLVQKADYFIYRLDLSYEDETFEEVFENAKEEMSELVNELTDALNEYAPPFVRFGAHEGDGAAFGWWPDLDSLHEAISYGVKLDDEHVYLPDHDLIVHINDHGNVTLYSYDMDEAHEEPARFSLTEVWSCV
jgi:hypothetical protein